MTEQAAPTAPEQRDDNWERNHLYGLTNELGWCGCGWGDDAYVLVRDLLDHFHDRDDRNLIEMIGSAGAAQIVLYRLQEADLIDHGTSVTNSWMTDKGRYARWLMHKHDPDALDHTGFPPCWDNQRDRCPDACWTPPADLPPEPRRPSLDELMADVKREADEARARMNPIDRAIHDEVDARMESYLLFGTPDPPEVTDEPGGLMRAAGIDIQAEADQIRARIDAARRAGTVDLLGQISPETSAQLWSAAQQTGHMQPEQFGGLLDALGFVGQRALDAELSAIPAYSPLRAQMGHQGRDVLPRSGRNTRIGCERHASGTWIHGWPHDCPKWARG